MDTQRELHLNSQSSRRFLKELEIGEPFTGFFVLRSRELRTRRDGQPYLVLELGDRSGRLFGNVWDDVEHLYKDLIEGGIVKVQGRIEEYRGQKQVGIKQIRNVRPEDNYNTGDFIPISDLKPEEALRQVDCILDSLADTHVKSLLESFFKDEKFRDLFTRAPGGKLWHHNRLGGLAEHTLGICRICRVMSRLYPEINRDVLLAGALLHDIGKIQEFVYETHIDYSNRGRLVGHISMGSQWVAQAAAELPEFPADLLDKIQHLVLSHQDEFGSPVLPMTQEAFILHYADQIDSKMDAIRRIRKDVPEGERWKFVNLLGRHLDVGEVDEDQS